MSRGDFNPDYSGEFEPWTKLKADDALKTKVEGPELLDTPEDILDLINRVKFGNKNLRYEDMQQYSAGGEDE